MLWFYGIINISFFQCGDRLYTSESDVYRRQILTCKDGPRTERVNRRRRDVHPMSVEYWPIWDTTVISHCCILFSRWLETLGLAAYVDYFHQKGLYDMFQLQDFTLEVSPFFSWGGGSILFISKDGKVYSSFLLVWANKYLFKHIISIPF